ncbi:uncharacterized protein LOC130670115 [Microplitis mediator]|uniref:uncharacterized protein LOC130670115 n=1 Tax=Microplitis mediator TaxID=375433 RepID=UPI00255504D9|nr:uncharacterized protein LOC130670115 [Microplitis mediator]
MEYLNSECDGDSDSSNSQSSQKKFKLSNAAKVSVQTSGIRSSPLKPPEKSRIPHVMDDKKYKLINVTNQSGIIPTTVSSALLMKKINEVLRYSQEGLRFMTEMEPKINQLSRQIGELSEKVEVLSNRRALGQDLLYPEYLPFATEDDVKNYENASDEDRTKFKHYITSFRGGKDVHENLRFVLKNNLIFKEELLVLFNYVEASEAKPNVVLGTQLDWDFYAAFRVMFPDMTRQQFKEAFKAALKAADTRVKKKIANPEKPPVKRKSRKNIAKDFYDKPYHKENDNTQ